MSFRTEANKVRAGIARGDYKKKRDYFASFVDPLVSGLETQAAAKMQEDLEKRREDRAAARELKKLQAAQDLEDKKHDAIANAFLMTQGATGAVAKSQVLALVKAGFDDPAKLTEYFEKNARFVGAAQGPNVPANVGIGTLGQTVGGVNQYSNESPIKVGDLSRLSQRDDVDPEVNTEAAQMAEILKPVGGEEGQFVFGKQPEKVDLTKLRDDNWESFLAAAQKEGNLEGISDINAWAKSRGLIKVVGQLTQNDINGKTLADLRKLKMQYGPVPEIEAAIVIEEAIEKDQAPWNNPAELALLDLNTLTAYKAGSSKLGKEAQGNIDSAIELRIAIDKSANLAQASQQLDKDSSFYEAALAKLGPVDANSPTAAQDLETFKTLTKLSSLAKENERDAKFQSERSKSAKELALDAYLKENGFFMQDAATGSIKYPGSGDMAEFERSWKELTDISEKPLSWFENDQNLLKLTTTQMKALLDTGLLPEDAQNKVQGFYNSMQETSVIERMTSTNFNSTTDIDQFLASQGVDTLRELDENSLNSLIAQRRVLLDKENEEQTDYNAYQEAAAIFFSKNPKTYENILKFEQEYKAGTAVPKDPDFVKRTLYAPNGDTIDVDSEDMQRQYIMQGFSAVKPGPVTQMLKDMGLEDNAENRAKIAQVKNGILSIGAKIDGTPIFINKIDGSATDVDMGNVSSPTVPTSILEIIPETGGLELSYVDADNNPKVITLSQEDIAKAKAFDRTISESARAGMQGAVGIRGVWNKFFGKITDAAGFQGFKNETNAIAFIEGLRLNTTVKLAAAQGTRDSVWQKQQILATLPETARFWQGPIETGAKVKNTLELIQQGIANLENELASDRVNKTGKSDAQKALIAMQDLQVIWSDLNSIFEEINAGKTESKPKVSSFLKPKTD